MAGPDLSLVTAAIDFSTVLEAVLMVAGAVLSVHVAFVGAKKVLAAVHGDDGYVSYEEMTDRLESGQMTFDEGAALQEQFGDRWAAEYKSSLK